MAPRERRWRRAGCRFARGRQGWLAPVAVQLAHDRDHFERTTEPPLLGAARGLGLVAPVHGLAFGHRRNEPLQSLWVDLHTLLQGHRVRWCTHHPAAQPRSNSAERPHLRMTWVEYSAWSSLYCGITTCAISLGRYLYAML